MPFTAEEFFEVFAQYNAAIWPLQILVYLAALFSVLSLFGLSQWRARVLTVMLAIMWAVNGVGYHWLFFSKVNPAAWLFGLVFVLQAVALAASTCVFPELQFAFRKDIPSLTGIALVASATIAYPAKGWLAGHTYPSTPEFGVAPCPTTIFTIGILLLGTWSATRWLLLVPILWSVIGGSAAILLQVPQDYGLIAGLLFIFAITKGRWLKLSPSSK